MLFPYTITLLAVAGFSLTIPLTRLAVTELSPVLAGPGRAIIAVIVSLVLLSFVRAKVPTLRLWPRLLLVGLGGVIVFPWMVALALEHHQSNHVAMAASTLPLITALIARVGYGERPPGIFWLWAGAGFVVVMVYLYHIGLSRFSIFQLYLCAGFAAVALAYAEGAKLSQELPSWQVISWASVAVSPIVLILVFQQGLPTRVGLSTTVAFLYLGLVSQWLAFVGWYWGLAKIGIAKASQVQLLQLFFTLAASSLVLHEAVPSSTVLFAVAASVFVLFSNKVRFPGDRL